MFLMTINMLTDVMRIGELTGAEAFLLSCFDLSYSILTWPFNGTQNGDNDAGTHGEMGC
jgi:hypothetical protein